MFQKFFSISISAQTIELEIDEDATNLGPNSDEEDSEAEELAYPIEESSMFAKISFFSSQFKCSNSFLIFKQLSAFLLVHNCLELTHHILTDRVIGHSAFKGADIVSALATIKKASINPKILAKECVCAPRLKGINTFPQPETIPADKKSNFF